MKHLQPRLWMLPLLALATACTPAALPTATQAPPPPLTATPPMPTLSPPATLVPPTVTSISTISLAALKNATYHLPNTDKTVQLVAGHYAEEAFTLDLIEPLAWGDLSADGMEDAAILLAERTGGTGTFVSLVVYRNAGGQPVQAGAVLVDDRPIINALSIQNQELSLAVTIHGINDPMCCPTFPVTQTYQLRADQLVLARFTSQTPNGLLRAITITDPPADTAVSGAVQVKGEVTISPFENTLGYRIYDAQGNELAAGPVSVTAPEMGGPGTFDASIDLSTIAPGTPIRLALQDLSAADGSILAMDSVELVVK